MKKKRKPTLKLLLLIYVPMFIVGMLIDLVLSKWGDASYAIGWCVGVCSALWWSKYIIDDWKEEMKGGRDEAKTNVHSDAD